MNLSPLPIQKFFDNNGRPLNGGLLFTYVAGTTTKIATYQDQAGTQNTNPVVLNFRGEANVWLDPDLAYKFVLSPDGDTDPPTNPIWSVDNISAAATFADLTQQFIGQILWPRTDSEIANSIFPVSYAYPPGFSARYATLQDAHDGLPAQGGKITLAEGTISFSGLILTKQVVISGAGSGISDSNLSATTLSYTGSGVAIEWQNGSRGSVLERFQLVNGASGTIGILINEQDPRIEDIYIYNSTSGFTGFSVAAIRIGTTIEVNDALLRDVYIRQQPALGIDLWQVSEGTFDHVRLIQNKGFQVKIGDAANGKSCNGLNFVNGTSPQTANDASSGGILIERSFFKLVFDQCQFESDSVNGSNYAIDAEAATVCDQIIVTNSYFTGNSWGASASYGLAINLANTELFIENVYLKNFSTAFVKNTLARVIDYERCTLESTPQVVDAFSTAVQQWTGTFTLTLTGMTGTVTFTVNFTRNRNDVLIDYTGASGTSNTTAMTGTGAPAGITPARQQRILAIAVLDNGGPNNVLGRVTIETSGVWTYATDLNGTGFTAANSKGAARACFRFSL